MTIENWLRFIETLLALIQTLIWPLVVLFIVIYFGTPLKKFLNQVSEFSFKAGATGLEATAKRQQVEAAALLGVASVKKEPIFSATDSPNSDEDKAKGIANMVSQTITPEAMEYLTGKNILWVDNEPANNAYERKPLEALGIRFATSLSTEEALEKLKLSPHDVIISDMNRPPDNQAGYTLLREIQKMSLDMPLIIYSRSNDPKYKVEARKRGAFGCTNNPEELFQLVVKALYGPTEKKG